MTPPLIALEEHYYSSAIFESLGDEFQRFIPAGLTDQLLEVGNGRLAAMDRGHISLQVVSHAFTPGERHSLKPATSFLNTFGSTLTLDAVKGSPSADNCRAGNDELALAVDKSGHPARFAAFAVLPCSNATESARELERTVSTLRFVGALIDNHADGKHFESADYDVLWAKACELDVPIYLHPTWPSPRMAETFMGAYSEPIGISLGAAGWGWHGDVGLHVLKLFCANVFDRFPALKIIIGHMGETLPFMLERCYDMSTRWGGGWGPHERPLRQVWDENIWITTSGAWGLGPIKCILENTKVERIMYSVDYPFESNEKGREWFGQLETSGLLTDEQLEMVACRNAERLLKVRVRGHRLPARYSNLSG